MEGEDLWNEAGETDGEKFRLWTRENDKSRGFQEVEIDGQSGVEEDAGKVKVQQSFQSIHTPVHVTTTTYF